MTTIGPLAAARLARHWRMAALEAGIGPAEMSARVEKAEAYQGLAECGVHGHGDRSEEL